MKFLHTGDIHLGKALGEFDLSDDQEYMLDQIIEIAIQEKVDAIMIAGDVFDRPVPNERAVRNLDSFLNKISKTNIDVYMISGNHDSDERLNFGSKLFQNNGIYVSSVFDGKVFKRTVKDDWGEVDIYMLPFVKASQVSLLYPDEEVEKSYEKAIRVVLEHTEVDTSRRTVLVTHQYVISGGNDPVLSGSEGRSAKFVGTLERVSASCFDAFDYVALGHIHSAQSIGREEVRYAGTPLKYSVKDVNDEKSVTLVTMEEKGSIDWKKISLKPKRAFRHLTGELLTLIDPRNVENTDDYIYVTLTDEVPIDDAMSIMQQVYPRTVTLDYENQNDPNGNGLDVTKYSDEKSFEALFREFYSMMYGEDVDEAELDIVLQAADEVGVR